VYWLGVGVVLVAAAFLLTDALLWTPGVTKANLRRLRPGMTVGQVEALLGKPDSARRASWVIPLDRGYELIASGEEVRLDWLDDKGGGVSLVFCAARLVGGVQRIGFHFPQDEGDAALLSRLRSWLGW
jgi:hypothetical protein